MRSIKNLLIVVLLFSAMSIVSAQEQSEPYDEDCLPLKIRGAHGPFDYRSATLFERDLVEVAHFNEHFEAYKFGKSRFRAKDGIAQPPAAGFQYTLIAFPNHHRALMAIEDTGFKQKTERIPGLKLRLHCYFQRAVKFVPDDGLVRALYGYYYARRGKQVEAEIQLVKAMSLRPDDLNVLVYVTTAYIEMNQFEKAAVYAKQAYAAGYPFPGLRSRIEKAGHSIE